MHIPKFLGHPEGAPGDLWNISIITSELFCLSRSFSSMALGRIYDDVYRVIFLIQLFTFVLLSFR